MANPIKGVVRKLTTRTESKPYGNSMLTITIWSFQIERFDGNNNLLPPVPAEIRGAKLVGGLNEGDEVEIVNPSLSDGIVFTKKIFNLTTKSIVESKKMGCAGIIILFLISSIAISLLLSAA